MINLSLSGDYRRAERFQQGKKGVTNDTTYNLAKAGKKQKAELRLCSDLLSIAFTMNNIA